MNNYSTNKEPVNFNLSTKDIIIIDALYLSSIKENIDFETERLNGKEGLISIEQKSLPLGGGTLIGYIEVPDFQEGIYELNPEDLEYWNDFESTEKEEKAAQQKDITTIGSDTGQLVISDLNDFPKLIKSLDYDEFVDYMFDEKLESYFVKIYNETNLSTWGIISMPEGGGSFKFDRSKLKRIKTTGNNGEHS